MFIMSCINEKLEVSKERRRQYKKDNKEHIAQKQKNGMKSTKIIFYSKN